MKLVVAIVQAEDIHSVTERLTELGERLTRINTHGGFLRRPNAILLVGTEDENVPRVLGAFADCCRARSDWYVPPAADDLGWFGVEPIEVEIGGATVFVLGVEQFVNLAQSRHFGELVDAVGRT